MRCALEVRIGSKGTASLVRKPDKKQKKHRRRRSRTYYDYHRSPDTYWYDADEPAVVAVGSRRDFEPGVLGVDLSQRHDGGFLPGGLDLGELDLDGPDLGGLDLSLLDDDYDDGGYYYGRWGRRRYYDDRNFITRGLSRLLGR